MKMLMTSWAFPMESVRNAGIYPVGIGPESRFDDEEIAIYGTRRLHGIAVSHADVPSVEDCTLRGVDLILDAPKDVPRIEGSNLNFTNLYLIPDGDGLPVIKLLPIKSLKEPVGRLCGVFYGLRIPE